MFCARPFPFPFFLFPFSLFFFFFFFFSKGKESFALQIFLEFRLPCADWLFYLFRNCVGSLERNSPLLQKARFVCAETASETIGNAPSRPRLEQLFNLLLCLFRKKIPFHPSKKEKREEEEEQGMSGVSSDWMPKFLSVCIKNKACSSTTYSRDSKLRFMLAAFAIARAPSSPIDAFQSLLAA